MGPDLLQHRVLGRAWANPSRHGDHRARSTTVPGPWVADAGPEVEVLAEVEGKVVAVRQGNLLATAFHPELSGEVRLHRWLVDLARAAKARGVHGQPPDPNG